MNVEIGNLERMASHRGAVPVLSVPADKHRLRVRFYAALLVLDCAAILLCFALANLIRGVPVIAATSADWVVVLVPIFVALAVSDRGIYGVRFFRNWRDSARRAIAALFIATVVVLFVSFYLAASAELSRAALTIGVLLSTIAFPLLRFGLYRLGMRMTRNEPLTELLIWDHDDCSAGPPAAAVSAAALNLQFDVNDPVALDRLGRLLRRADRVVISCADNRREAWAMMLKGTNVQGEILAPELARLGALNTGTFGDTPTLMVSIGPLDTRSRALKRALDLTLATAAVLVLLPLIALVALAIRIDDGGPILFVQMRLGRGNRLFSMYKFRSMRSEACDSDGTQSTARHDHRVTRVGRLIRATSIDELPQLFNVLKGDMSLVGPRPHALGSLAGEKLFWEVDQRYWHRHAAKPGITGLAQVKGFRGATHVTSDLTARLQADLDYLAGWSLWRDIAILVRTVTVVLHKNAY